MWRFSAYARMWLPHSESATAPLLPPPQCAAVAATSYDVNCWARQLYAVVYVQKWHRSWPDNAAAAAVVAVVALRLLL